VIAHLAPAEVAAIASHLTARQWAAIQERFAAVGLTERQRKEWAAIQVELAADLEAWRRAHTNLYFNRADFSQLLWSHCRLLARFNALLHGIAELFPEEIDEEAIIHFMLFVQEGDCDSQPPTMH
jgi:hypothetical protein